MDCSICLERFDQDSKKPMVLECGHTFCIHCVYEIYKKSKIECPIDRSALLQPLKKVKINYSLQDIVSSFSSISLNSPLKSEARHSPHQESNDSSIMELEESPSFPNLLCTQGHPLKFF
jgi:hypothetical protein